MNKEFDKAVKEARRALREKNRDAFLNALLDVEILIDTLVLGEREIIEEQDLIFSAVKEGMFIDIESLSNKLIDLRRTKEGIKDYKLTFKKLKKNIEEAFELSDQDTFFRYLFEFEDLLKEHDLPEVLRSEGMKYWDVITKKADDAGWLGKKEKPKREARPSQWEKRDVEIKRLMEKGVPREKAIEYIDQRILKRAGLTMCPICGNVINLKREEYIVIEGVPYHSHCAKKKKEKEKERLAEIPLVVRGIDVHCEWCKKVICKGTPVMFEAPAGVEDYRDSLETQWFHHSKTQPCYKEWLKSKGEGQ